MKVVDNKFDLGQIVYLKTDADQRERIVTGFCIRQAGQSYELMQGNIGSWHYDFEISEEKNVLMSTTNG
jgi:hypothetical protein